MSEKRYFKVEYDEEWYLFDSTTISEQLVKEQAEYGYGVFANTLSPSEVVGLLNELSEENRELRQFISKGRRLSVKELMDNANENELLKKKIRGLEKENEQLKKGGKE